MIWMLYAILSALFAALVAIIAKMGIQVVDPLFATTFRAIIMALFFVLLSVMLDKFNTVAWHAYTMRDWFYVIASALAGAIGWLCYFLALDAGSASHVVAIDRLGIVFVLVLSAFIFGEPLTLIKGIGALLMLVGAIMITAC